MSPNWEELATLSQAGDKKAYHQLLSEIYPYISGVLGKSLSDYSSIDDIAQEVLISVHKALPTYSNDRPFKPWLLSIINFRKIDYLRRYYKKKEDKTSSIEDNLTFEAKNVTDFEHYGELKDVEQALDELSPQQQSIFTKIKIEGYTAIEVANQTGLKESTVKVTAHRAMIKLRDFLSR